MRLLGHLPPFAMVDVALQHAAFPLRARAVCRSWRRLHDEGVAMRNPGVATIFAQILRGRASTLSFEYCHRTIYNACLRRRHGAVILALRALCVDLGPLLAWQDRLARARLIADVCLHLPQRIHGLNTARFALGAMTATTHHQHACALQGQVGFEPTIC